MSIRTAGDKAAVMKERAEAQRKLGAQIDTLIRQAEDGPTPGCGLCSIWRRMTGRQRAAMVAVATDEAAASSTAATGTTMVTQQSRLFGLKKSDPHAKLAAAAAAMEARVKELELRSQSERAEARSQMQAGQKASALRMLKRAKLSEKQLEANQQSLMAIEQQVDLMAQAQMQKQLAAALASSSKGMKAQKKMLQSAESAVDEAQDARDMADDLGNVMAEFASNGNGGADEEELLAELQQMIDDDPAPPGPSASAGAAMVDVPLDEEAKQAEIAELEARLARYDASVEKRRAVEAMPAAPKGPVEKQALLASVSNGHV
jgi:hypothetical protein